MGRFLGVVLCLGLMGCTGSPTQLGELQIGTRRGQEDRVDVAAEVKAGSFENLAAQVEVSGDAGWVVATWTLWEEAGQGKPRVVHTKFVHSLNKSDVFFRLPGNTTARGWQAGTITCDFKTGSGEAKIGRIRVAR